MVFAASVCQFWIYAIFVVYQHILLLNQCETDTTWIALQRCVLSEYSLQILFHKILLIQILD